MSEDIVKRLRVPSDLMTEWTHVALHGEAAAEIECLRDLVADLEREADWLRPRAKLAERDRRERIATACLVGLIACPSVQGNSPELCAAAISFADELISRLDAEAKP